MSNPLQLPTPMDPDVCARCGAPTPRYVPLGPVYCSGVCWREATSTARANTKLVLADVAGERAIQDAKWGEQSHDPAWWLAILTEEVGEVAQEVLGLRFGEAAKAHGDLRTELLHVAAVAVSAIETLDFGAAGMGVVA